MEVGWRLGGSGGVLWRPHVTDRVEEITRNLHGASRLVQIMMRSGGGQVEVR